MARKKIYNNSDFRYNELQNSVLHLLDDFPAGARKGQIIYHTIIKSPFVCWNGIEDGADTTDVINWRVGRIAITDLYSNSEPAGEILVTDGSGGYVYQAFGSSLSSIGCTTTEQVLDAVYISANDKVAQAKADSYDTSSVFGFVTAKTSPTICSVITKGFLSGFTGLVAGKTYFLDPGTAGAITTDPPTGSGQVLIKLGKGLNATTLYIDIDDSRVVRV